MLVLDQIPGNQMGQSRRVALICLNAGLNVGLSVDISPLNLVSSLMCDLIDEQAQGATISLSKWVKHVQLAQLVAGAGTELFRPQSQKKPIFGEVPGNLRCIRRYMRMVGESSSTLRDIYCA